MRDRRDAVSMEHGFLHADRYLPCVIETMADPLIIVGVDGNILLVNRAMCDLLGYKEKELLGAPVGKVLEAAASDMALFSAAGLAQLIAQGTVHDLDVFYKMKSGQKIPVSFSGSVMRDTHGQVLGIVGIGHDLRARLQNERKKMELMWAVEALKIQKQTMESIVRSAADMIVVVDYDGTITVVNEAVVRCVGLVSAAPLIGASVDTLFADEEVFYKREAFGQLLRNGFVQNLRGRFHTQDGADFPVLFSGSAMRDDQGKLLGLVLVAKDITELEKVEKIKDEFVSTVSHELRTPLTILKGSMANLTDGIAGPITERQGQICQTITRNTFRLEQLVNNLLDLSRLERGLLVKRVRIDTRALLKRVCHELEMEATRHGCQLQMQLASDLPDLDGDPSLVTQMLTNLLANAVRFARNRIVVAARADDTASVELRVTDDGPGISAEVMPRLFHKFEQFHRPEGGAGYKGTGLGLAICKEIVECGHHGRIWAESVLGQGSSFCCLLPRWKEGTHGQ